jgi:hypothetical protein
MEHVRQRSLTVRRKALAEIEPTHDAKDEAADDGDVGHQRHAHQERPFYEGPTIRPRFEHGQPADQEDERDDEETRHQVLPLLANGDPALMKLHFVNSNIRVMSNMTRPHRRYPRNDELWKQLSTRDKRRSA